jgi:hypothetical protein
MVPESLEAQDAPAEESEQQQGDDDEDDNEEYSPLSDSKVLVDRLHALLVHMGITTTSKYRIKGVPRPGWVEYRAIAEIFSISRVIRGVPGASLPSINHQCCGWCCLPGHHLLEPPPPGQAVDLVYRLIPQWKKDQFKVPGMKKGIPKMEMVHYQDLTCPTRDPVSLNPVAAHRHHYLSLPEDGRGSG